MRSVDMDHTGSCWGTAGRAARLAVLAMMATIPGAMPVVAQRSIPTPTTTKTLGAVGPAPTGLAVTGTPATASLRWDRMAGISGYLVLRSMDGGQSWVTLTSSVLLAESFADGSGLDPRMGYLYRVIAQYPDGRQGPADVAFTPPQPINPTGFAAKQTGNNQVQLSWQPVPGAAYYVVFGPGSTNGGAKVAGTSLTVTGVPTGVQEWAIGSYYEPGPVATQVAVFPRTSVTVTPPAQSGRYLITLTGVRAITASFDDVLSRDGQGDEVYAAAHIRRYDRRNGGVLEFFNRKTLTYGDTKGFGTARVQAGTRSATGGIRDGDPVPANVDPSQRSLSPSDFAFPLKLFEGTLTDGVDALVISTSLWEEDGFNQQYVNWDQQMASITPTLFSRPEIQNQISGQRFGQLVFGASLLNDGTLDAVHYLASYVSGVALLSNANKLFEGGIDRGIGLVTVGTVELFLPNTMVVLTREIIEAGLAPIPPGTPPFGLPVAWPRMPRPGVIMIPVVDGKYYGPGALPITPARYEMYLNVERIP